MGALVTILGTCDVRLSARPAALSAARPGVGCLVQVPVSSSRRPERLCNRVSHLEQGFPGLGCSFERSPLGRQNLAVAGLQEVGCP